MLSRFSKVLVMSRKNVLCTGMQIQGKSLALFSTSVNRYGSDDFQSPYSGDGQGVQGKPIHDAAPAWNRESAQDCHVRDGHDFPQNTPKCHMTRREMDQSETVMHSSEPQEMVFEDSYQHSSNVSLYSVMQSNVPEPCASSPTHFNMPAGGESQHYKYISGMLNDTHPSHQPGSNMNPGKSDSEVSKMFARFASTSASDPNVEGKRNTGGSPTVGGQEPSDKKLSQKDRLKRAVKEYGATVIVFHIGISLISLGGFYLAVSSGIDVVALLHKVGVGEVLLSSRIATGASTFVIAYAVHKVFAPVRIAITLTSTPFIVRFLRIKGILKPPKVKV